MTLLIIDPGVAWSVADVFTGLCDGLIANRIDVITAPPADALRRAIDERPDVVIAVTGLRYPAGVLDSIRAVGVPVYVLFTESPYEHEAELALAATVDGCWTHERTSVDAFKAVCPRAWYLPHAWHPARHGQFDTSLSQRMPDHDVVFVGSGFPERIGWFNSIDWTGIDLGLYGIWEGFGLKPELEACIKSGPISNQLTASLYRHAKIGLNLYRWPHGIDHHGESLNPRAYELAACGCFSISQHREESRERFGASVPLFTTPQYAERLIRHWLTADAARAAYAEDARGVVARDSWTQRAERVVWDLIKSGVPPGYKYFARPPVEATA